MKNPFASKKVSPVLLLLEFALLLSFGILCLANARLAFSLLQWAAALSLLLAGISRSWSMFSEKKYLIGAVTLALLLAAAVVMVVSPLLVVDSAGILFGLWFLITGGAKATICVQCVVQKLHGRIRYGFSALLSLVFGVLLIFFPTMQISKVFSLAGIYLILYSATLLVDAVSEIFLFGTVGAKVKTRLRISLPLFLTALLPGKLLDEFNEYFKLNPQEAAKFLNNPDASPQEKTPLEIFIHLSDRGTQRTGHVDLRYGDTVYSYGCYDHHAHKFGGMMSDGTMVLCDSQKYIAYCLREEEKILVGFGLSLSPRQKEAVEASLEKITRQLVPWQSDFEKGVADMKAPDAASQLVAETGAKIYKVAHGPFRNYYALNTNCVKLADQVVGSYGLGLVCVGGITVPGSYYTMLNDLYEKSNSFVTQRNIYKDISGE